MRAVDRGGNVVTHKKVPLWTMRIAALALAAFAAGGVASCGLSEEDATDWCNQLRDNDPFGSTCITDESFDQCVSCYMECGKCREIKTCPQTFECYE